MTETEAFSHQAGKIYIRYSAFLKLHSNNVIVKTQILYIVNVVETQEER